MKATLKRAFMSAVFATGVIGGGWGGYTMVDTAAREFITEKSDFRRAKECVEKQRSRQSCLPDDHAQVALYVDAKKSYATGLSFFFGGMSMIRMGLPFVPVPALRRRKKLG